MRYVLKIVEYEDDDSSWFPGEGYTFGMVETASHVEGFKRSKWDTVKINVVLPNTFLQNHLPNELRELLYDMEDRVNTQE